MNRQNIEDIYPLSPMQHGMLFHTLLDAQSEVYFEQIHCTLGDTLNAPAFLRAWKAVVARHPMLRTVFLWEGMDDPLQVVLREVELVVHEEDLRALDPAAQQARFDAHVEADKHIRFDFGVTPPLRFALFRVAEGTYRFLWSFHHLVLDGWSLPILMGDLFALYGAYTSGKDLRLPKPKPFGDYIDWLGQQDLAKAEAFWRNRLKGFVAATPYRVDRPISDQHAGGSYDEVPLSLGREAAERLFAFGRQHKLTLSTLVRAAWSLLLMRYSGEDDVCFGATVSGRSAAIAGMESVVGMCINMMPVRAEMPVPAQSALAWLTAFQAKQAELSEYEYSPLVDVQTWSDVPRGEPLFQSILTFENYPFDEAMLGGAGDVRVRDFFATLGSNYPVTVVCLPSEHDVSFRIVYDTRRFDAKTAARLAGHLGTLLAGLSEAADWPVSRLPMLSKDEEQQLLVAWNDTAAPSPGDVCAHELFECWAKETPDAPAVRHEAVTLTYRELDSRANRLARWLVAQGVGPDSLVGIGMKSSEAVVVALLAAMKAGGAYVPIDPALPDDRIAHILADTGAKVVLTSSEHAARYAKNGVTTLRLDADQALFEGLDASCLGRIASPQNLAYVLFTSGSTGKSKGVMLEHQQLVQYLAGVRERLGVDLDAGASYALVSTFAADLGNTVLYASLCGGGVLHVMGEERTKDPHAIAEYFSQNPVDCMKIVPSHLQALLDSPTPEAVVPRKVLVLGGEASSWELVERLRGLRPSCAIINHYGPTETTVGVITYAVGERRADAPIVPLGRPLANVTLYLLDKHGNPVPVGVPGEVFIGGAQVARGYLNRPELTAERFVHHPFSDRAGALVYRTGDSAKYLETGDVLFLGRVDFQVKIRGYRIELGEIEAALRENPSVRDAVTLVRDDGGDKRIIAFVVAMDPPAPAIASVREHLALRVPDYMMPSALRWIEAVPLTPNGKIDRNALFALEEKAEAAEADGAFAAPRTPVEEVLASIWADVFGVEKVSVNDNFNDLGGHSLLAIQVIARTRDALKVQVPLRAIFDSPTVAGLADRVEAAMRAKQGLNIPALQKAAPGAIPLSFAQERLWFLDQLEPGSAFYNVPAAIHLTGRLDVDALERAIGEVVRRHDVLRARFEAEGGKARVVVEPFDGFRLPEVDAHDEAGARALADAEASRPFDLARGPLFRARLIRIAGASSVEPEARDLEHLLLFTMHHIVSDGWARGVLVRELATLYEAFLKKKASPLPELPLQYSDFAVWQRGWLTDAVLAKEVDYWKKKLVGAPAALELPTDRPRPPTQSFKGGLYRFELPKATLDAAKLFAKGEGATLFMVLLAAFDTLLARYARQTDVVVGSPIANRSQAALEGLIGFFVNTLVLRSDLSGDPTFKELVKRVRETALGAYAHQDLPFERLVEALSPERDRSRAPLFQVMFVLQNAPLPPLSLPSLLLAPLDADSGTSKFDLTLTLAESPSGQLLGGFEYASDLFDEATVARMAGHFGVLLAACIQEPKTRVSDLPLMTEAETHTVVRTFNARATRLPEGAIISDLIELEASTKAEAIAVTCGDESLSYGALVSRGRRLARLLSTRGVNPGDRVAISVPRSLDMAVGIVGILLAGATYVPFDPAWPRDRLAHAISDAEVKLFLTHEELARGFGDVGVKVLLLDAEAASIEQTSDAPVARGGRPDSLAYIIYTSGSTGKPKGVGVTHANLVYSTVARFSYYAAAPLEAFLLLSSFSFDSSVAGIFWSLASGAKLVLPREKITEDPREIAALIEQQRVTHLLCVPSLYALILDEAGDERLSSLKAAIVAGEATLPDLVARHHHVLATAKLYNEYGPTEATVWCTAAELTEGESRGRVSIGKPIPNAEIYLLDERLRPVPLGVPGEIVVGGPGVTPGYLNLPEQTAERFLDSPFGEGRLYRTGDLGRFRSDGSIEFLGRVDQQVKIRGYRIEIDEIEGALAAHKKLREVAVVLREDTPGDKRLVGYYVVAEEPAPTVGELRTHLAATLPDYMIPRVLLRVPAIPLGATGKIDRKALPAPEARAGLESSYAAPRSPVEEVISGIWSELLSVPQPGIHDDFFQLGGHSLLATQVVARIRKALDLDLPLQRLFETPTIAGLAQHVETALREGHGLVVPPVTRASREGPLALSFAQERLWFLDQLEPDNPFYNVPSAIRITGRADLDALARTLTAIVERHEALRTRFPTEGGKAVQVIDPPSEVRLSVVDLTALDPETQVQVVRSEAEKHARVTFHLATGPLYAARIVKLGAESHVLLFTMHHIVSDGWSIGVLLQELGALYDALVQGRPSPLPELPIQYADYAAWQRRYLEGEILGKQAEYWRKQLRDAPLVLELPTDKPRPALQSYRGARVFFEFPDALTAAVRGFSQKSGVTPFMTLLSAFNALLGRYSGQDDILVGTPIANRTRVETESLIGFLVNTLVLRADLSGEPTFHELVLRAREVTLAAYANQDLPFERLVEEVAPERDLSRAPVFQVMFVLQNFSWPALKLSDLLLEEVDADIVTAKFDIMLTVIEGQEGLGQKGKLYGKIEYNTDLFEQPTMQRFVAHYLTLLESAVQAPDTAIGALALLPEAERAQVVTGWNDTARPYRTGVTLQQLFMEQVDRTPDAVALVFEGETLSYRQLDERSNRLAHRLRKLGVKQDVMVAVSIERSFEMLVALYAVIKAGGAYVPVDPTYPKARIAFFLEDASSLVLLTQAKIAAELPPVLGTVVCLDTGWSEIEQEPATRPEPLATSSDLAYMIYTSGSTGKPKGAMNSHAGIVNRLQWMQEAYHLGADDAVLQKTPFSFDVSVWELFWPLQVGARLVIAKPEGHKDAGYLVKLIQAERVTTMHFVPSMLQAFLEEPTAPTAKSLRRVVASGEALPLPLTLRFFEALPDAELHNLYGPTEAAVDVTWWACQKEPPLPLIPIGKPIANTQIYILDKNLSPVPIGVPGELYIGGVQVARGYWNRPELTAERFVRDPFGKQGDRLYRTGDLTRWLPDGNIEYIRRIDFQVKLRGFRIELGEIEGALGQSKAVRESVVTVREDLPGDKRIVAYLVLDPSYREAEKAAPEADAATADRTSQWQMLYEETYRQSSAEDAAFNIVGWNSSYTLGAIPPEEMRIWVDETVRQIRELAPERVLEMGCGTGLLLFNVAPHVKSYTGADFSQAALDYIEAQKGRVQGGLANVELSCRMADDYAGLADASFDAVVVNSVVQYFPSVDYLVKVVEGALRVVRPGGHIFLGDIRNLALLRALKASVALFQALPNVSVGKLRDQMLQGVLAEEELVLDPQLFALIAAKFPAISQVEVRPKPGQYDNELSRFRSDVVLHVGPREAVSPPAWLDWQRDGLTYERIEEALRRGTPLVGVRHLPNARVEQDRTLVEMLLGEEGLENAADLRDALKGRAERGVDPEALRALGAEHGYQVFLSLLSGRSDGALDVVFAKRGVLTAGQVVAFTDAQKPVEARPWSHYGNDPLRNVVQEKVVTELKRSLAERLPDYMVPSAFVVLDALPLSPNGKVDRRALPAPEARIIASGDVVAPRNPVEEVLVGIYAQLLGLERVSVFDDFFSLGGHSLLATQAISRVRSAFNVDLPLTVLFEASTVADLASRVEGAVKDGYGVAAPPIVPTSREGSLSLSFGQERLWFLDQLEPNSTQYNVPAAVRLAGRLDVSALEAAISEVLARHEVLRTVFPTVKGRPAQKLREAEPFVLATTDFGGLPPEERERRLREETQLDSQMPFDLGNGPLVRAHLLRLSDDEHVLIFTLHHIVSDGWSLGILVREVAALYEAFAAKKPSPLPALPVQYADYAAWQRRYLDGEVLQRQLAFWKAALTGAPQALELPSDRPRPPMQSFHGAQVKVALPASLSRALTTFSRQEGVTLYMTLLAAFQLLLARWSGQDDIVVGTPIANRTRSETEGLIGFLINTLVIRGDLSGDPTFRGLVARIRTACLGAYAHQDVPFERLVEELRPERDLSRSPLFQVMFALQNTPLAPVRVTGLSLSGVPTEATTAKFDLTLTLEEGEDGLVGYFEYVTELFDASTIERMAAHFRTLLEGIVADPGATLGALPLLPRSETRTLLVDWNLTAAEYAKEARLFDAIGAQATANPAKTAVVFADEQLSYGELWARSNRFARHLSLLGVGEGVRVGLYVERSAEMVVALLGILLAGGSYVPLDPAYPKARIAMILEDAGAPVVVTQASLLDTIQVGSAKLVQLDADREEIAKHSDATFLSPATADTVAYAIYTSGSTGKPKGVLVHHRALVNFLTSMAQVPGLGASDRLLAVTSLSFDIAGLELYLPLTVGATVDVADRDTSADGKLLLARLSETRPSMLQATPATFRLLLEAGWEGDPNLTILCGGEAFPRPMADSLVDKGKVVWNMFGPTETTIWSTVQRVEKGLGSVPIGRPIANTEVYVVDRSFNPAPIGVAGELLIGGDGVAKGYFQRDELTAERFIDHPLRDALAAAGGEARSEKVYRTGDLVRWLPNGAIEFLGRLDHQVKLRGYRIELGEIETVLGSHPAVREVVVVAREDVPGDKRLVAYVSLLEGMGVSIPEARAHLREKLPDYMLPAHFVVLPALPRTPNGKVDRKALPVPDHAARKRVAVPPRSAAERLVLSRWKAVLRVDELGVTDDFFEVGGHSLLAAELVAKLSDAFRIPVPVRTLFEAGTVEGVVKAIETLWGDPEVVETVAETVLAVEEASEEELQKLLDGAEAQK